MEPVIPSQLQLVGPEIHGFKTMQDLDVPTMFEEAKTRWLRPNEIHAILCNHNYFNIHVKPMNLPRSGTIVLFDRKMLRNFRRDGHNWKKKKDGKTVKEAHEHLKVGNDERIHVYYAHGEDQTTFVRRCYWLLDKKLEHIVLVHYRDTQELQGSPNFESNASSDPPTSWNLSEENEGIDQVHYAEPNETIINHEMRLHEINTLDWDELVVVDGPNKLITPERGNISYFDQDYQYGMLQGNDTSLQNNSTFVHKLLTDDQSATFRPGTVGEGNTYDLSFSNMNIQRTGIREHSNLQMDPKLVNVSTDSLDTLGKDGMENEDSFGRWMNYTMTDSPVVIDGPTLTPERLVSTGQGTVRPPSGYNQQSHSLQQIFSITDISPSWASSNEETKILVVGVFHEEHRHLANSNLFCVCGDVCLPVEVVQSGVFRCFVSRHSPGIVNLFISYDGHKPISQVMAFEYRAPPINKSIISSEEKSEWEDFQNTMRLAHLLFSSSRSLNILSSKVPAKALKEAKIFAHRTRSIVNSWDVLINSITGTRISFQRAKSSLLELTLQTRLLEWLLERILDGGKIPDRDVRGQGVIHLCAILDYTWAMFPYSWSGLSIDFRDKLGWTALHWAAYYGRQKSVASLLSAGANPNLVTDPTSENPGGCTPADLASKSGYEGLAAFLAEKALLAHFEAMTLAGNVSGSLQCTIPTDDDFTTNGPVTEVNEEEQYLKDTLSAYRRAADAAARIQAAFREQSFKLKTKALEFVNAEDEARCIIAAMRIQHAFRHYETKKQMAAAVRIQHRFRTWKIRKDFLNKRRQAIKIQAFFRGLQVRREYKKILWSVGVLEKAIIRWRLKRKGFRGLEVAPIPNEDEKQEISGEEEFFKSSRKQAEERVERSVVRVQAMFRSKRAQEEYRKMKLALNQAGVEYEELSNPVTNMER
ncbi:calmodulin-binding transcription activator 6-like isoform X1 [Cynara cardunculus var. scolymus]|uniref:calmodulin-binding transcription activator 6-like isoform X1 n=1 Tax=Cynara cardunculus var. scolymus TaxID=59895 RepID=UPI000D62E772|nr:calmodulin-binding transcription activator 6-like isoform X1 [Cynara cardunculus var. scolymus]